ncbi:rhodanese-like domain-containing protein [Pannonibacter phragmitetus]|jgi:rhodanese-related sulfurtransferase|uniref:rhodanese-like domain-containing protein n=1 Tax=Pannonibacter phragmitetus TaxID=121719 RepID=UPI000E6664F0|nr:rhodanese-like domain-containing protein [Pannonibacter phragmitetus]
MAYTVSISDLAHLLQHSSAPVLLDVRRRPAFDQDSRIIPGAIWKDPFAVGEWAREIAPATSVIVYCVHGREVSNGVVNLLRTLGFDAWLIEGGIEAWKAAGGILASDRSSGEIA